MGEGGGEMLGKSAQLSLFPLPACSHVSAIFMWRDKRPYPREKGDEEEEEEEGEEEEEEEGEEEALATLTYLFLFICPSCAACKKKK